MDELLQENPKLKFIKPGTGRMNKSQTEQARRNNYETVLSDTGLTCCLFITIF